MYNKNKYDVSVAVNAKIGDFKKQLQGLLGMCGIILLNTLHLKIFAL